MISGAAFCPQPPVLVPAVASGAAAELTALRATCRAAITKVASLSDHLLIVGSGDQTFTYESSAVGSFAKFGVDFRVALGPDTSDTPRLPLSLAVGAELIEDAIGDAMTRRAVCVAADDAAGGAVTETLYDLVADARVGLIVMGDGSARRSTAAPGYLDERAVPFDDAIAEALRAGDAYALEDLDVALADELLVAGAPAWRATGRLLRNARFDAELLAYEAPFGVAYFVATWIVRA